MCVDGPVIGRLVEALYASVIQELVRAGQQGSILRDGVLVLSCRCISTRQRLDGEYGVLILDRALRGRYRLGVLPLRQGGFRDEERAQGLQRRHIVLGDEGINFSNAL